MCAGGAAGLTLTAAQAVFLMEPAINPGLEAQAAARIHRLGEPKKAIKQTPYIAEHPCAVDHISAEDTILEVMMLVSLQ